MLMDLMLLFFVVNVILEVVTVGADGLNIGVIGFATIFTFVSPVLLVVVIFVVAVPEHDFDIVLVFVVTVIVDVVAVIVVDMITLL